MSWVEIITLRSHGSLREALVRELLKPMPNGSEMAALLAMRVYRNPWVATDVSIHLCWDGTKTKPQESPIGLRLSETLKGVGLVNHSVWVEETREREPL